MVLNQVVWRQGKELLDQVRICTIELALLPSTSFSTVLNISQCDNAFGIFVKFKINLKSDRFFVDIIVDGLNWITPSCYSWSVIKFYIRTIWFDSELFSN